MITNRLKNLFGLSVLLFIAHGTEEIITGLASVDSHVAFLFGSLAALPALQALFILFQIAIWTLLITTYLLLRGEKWHLVAMVVVAIVFLYELHHLYKVIEVGGYYPGAITAVPLYIVGLFFWKELIKNLQQIKSGSNRRS
jgi:hypothetical protein